MAECPRAARRRSGEEGRASRSSTDGGEAGDSQLAKGHEMKRSSGPPYSTSNPPLFMRRLFLRTRAYFESMASLCRVASTSLPESPATKGHAVRRCLRLVGFKFPKARSMRQSPWELAMTDSDPRLLPELGQHTAPQLQSVSEGSRGSRNGRPAKRLYRTRPSRPS